MDFNHLFTLIFGGTFGLLGLIFFCIGIGTGRRVHRRNALCCAVVQARLEAVGGRRLVAYQVGELTYERPCPEMGTRAYAIGQPMTVYYDPHDPGLCRVEGEGQAEKIIMWLFGGLGILFLIIALVTAIILL